MIARSHKPAVIIGTLEELFARLETVTDPNRDFVMRPCGPDELLLRAYGVLRFVETLQVAAQPAERNSIRLALIANDDATTIALISTILKHFNFECDIARDGAEALDVARKKKPDLILLDVSMPNMNGFETLTALRNDLATVNTPIFMITASHSEAEIVKAFSLGANDYITKPFNAGEMMARINRALRE